MKQTELKYIILTRGYRDQWDSDYIGDNRPRSYAECEADIKAFRAGWCGKEPEWIEGEYRIVPVGLP